MCSLATRSAPEFRSDLLVVPHPSDKILATAYLLMEKEGLSFPDGSSMSVLETVYYQGVPTLKKFLEELSDGSVTAMACFEKSLTSDIGEFRGIGWIHSPCQMGENYRKSEVAFAFLAGGSIFTKLAFGRKMMDWIFDHIVVDVLFGTTPAPNMGAVGYARRLGFSMYGPIPEFAAWKGYLTDVWISKLSRQDWSDSRKVKENLT